jgi:hypothetical protein
VADEVDYFEAYETVLTPMFAAHSTLRLVAGACAAGVIGVLRSRVTEAEIVAETGVSAGRAAELCRALVATGVAEQKGDTFSLTPAWHALTDPGAYVPLEIALEGNMVEGRLLTAASGDAFWKIPPEDQLTYARSVSPNPYSQALVESFRRQILDDPDRARMADGGRLLEFGCGVAGRVLTTLRAMPRLSAVGVELSPVLAEEATRRARDLGLADRFRVVCVDAADFSDTEAFDFGFWSQFFFPASSRQAALRAMWSALRPGATLHAPVGADVAAIQADPTSSAARDYALWRVVLDSWGVPERSAQSLAEEIAHAGFIDTRVVERPGGPIVRASRP